MKVQAPSASSKWLLAVMANLARPPAHRVFASAATMATITQLDRKTVLNSTIALEAAGLIQRTGEKAGRGGAPVFTLPVDIGTDTENGSGSEQSDSQTEPENWTGSLGTSTKNGLGLGNGSSGSDTENGSSSLPTAGRTEPKCGMGSSEPDPKTGYIYKEKEIKRVRRLAPAPTAQELLPEVEAQTLADWELVRKSKRGGPITATVAKMIRKQAVLAGLSLQDAVEFCCGRSWISFNATWYANASGQAGAGPSSSASSGDLWSGAK